MKKWKVIVVYIELILTIFALGLVGQLTFYHAWLARKGITTFQHISFKREIKMKEKDLKVS